MRVDSAVSGDKVAKRWVWEVVVETYLVRDTMGRGTINSVIYRQEAADRYTGVLAMDMSACGMVEVVLAHPK